MINKPHVVASSINKIILIVFMEEIWDGTVYYFLKNVAICHFYSASKWFVSMNSFKVST